MQKWLKFQLTSRNLNKKILFVISAVLLISIPLDSFAQDKEEGWLDEDERNSLMEKAVPIEQQIIIFEVGKHSDVHVKHIVETGKWNQDRPKLIEILPGAHSNLIVNDEDGDRLSFSFNENTFGESEWIILNQKLGCCDLVAEYDLENFMELENGLWKKDLIFPFDVMVMFDDEVDLIFANSRPIDVSDAKGINCMGCALSLEHFDDDKIVEKSIIHNEKEFLIQILSNGDISNIEYVSGGNQLLNFNVENSDQLFILKIPFGLILNPFDVYFTEKDDTELEQLDKIRKTEFNQSDVDVNLSFRTTGEGIVSIVGATQEEHERVLEKTQERIQDERGIQVDIPNSGENRENSDNTMINEKEELSFVADLQKSGTEDSQDYTIILAIIGIIAAIIIGVIVKIKKN